MRERLLKLVRADGYGTREGLLREANLLLTEQGMRELVAELEAEMALLVAKHKGAGQVPYEVIKVSAALSLIAEALGDPDVKARAVLSYRADPNPMQRESMAQAYLEANRPEDAMRWLQGDWGHLDDRRQRLLAQAHGQRGNAELSHQLRQELFEAAPSLDALRLWLDDLPPHQQGAALQRAGEIAVALPNPGLSAQLLLELHRDADAEAGARQIAASALCKCSWYGQDPYWGRLASELGVAGIAMDQEKVSVSYGGVTVAAGGVTVEHDEAAVAEHMAQRHLDITCDLGLGDGTFTVLTNDLTHAYIDENTGGS